MHWLQGGIHKPC